jgi:hypothetical protein
MVLLVVRLRPDFKYAKAILTSFLAPISAEVAIWN